MRPIVSKFAIGIVFLALAVTSAPGPADARDVLSSHALIKLISLDAPLNELEGAMNGDALKEIQTKAKGARDPKFDAAWKKAVHAAFSGSELQEELAAKLNGLLTPKEQQIILDFYSKGLGKTVTQLEKAAQTADMEMQILMQARALTKELNANPKRKAQYAQIVEGLKLIEGSVNMMMSTMAGTQFGILAANDANSQKTFDAIQQDLGAQKPMLKQLIGRMMPIIMAHTYKPLSDAQMEAYKAFVLSPTGRKLYTAIDTATDAVMREAGIEFGAALMKDLR